MQQGCNEFNRIKFLQLGNHVSQKFYIFCAFVVEIVRRIAEICGDCNLPLQNDQQVLRRFAETTKSAPKLRRNTSKSRLVKFPTYSTWIPGVSTQTSRSPSGAVGGGSLRRAWVTEFSGKAPYWEMRRFASREKQPQSGALGTASQQPAS